MTKFQKVLTICGLLVLSGGICLDFEAVASGVCLIVLGAVSFMAAPFIADGFD